ncbi:MAG: response regulator [Desulfosalsimonadaceae bacterium]
MRSKKKVLIIDDEEDFCFFVRENLLHTGRFDVFVATNGAYGIELARTQLPDIILLDLMMPDMSGEQVADELNASRQTGHIPKIFLTALATKDDTGSNVLKKSGGSYFVAKPVRTKELVMAIEKVLEDSGGQ